MRQHFELTLASWFHFQKNKIFFGGYTYTINKAETMKKFKKKNWTHLFCAGSSRPALSFSADDCQRNPISCFFHLEEENVSRFPVNNKRWSMRIHLWSSLVSLVALHQVKHMNCSFYSEFWATNCWKKKYHIQNYLYTCNQLDAFEWVWSFHLFIKYNDNKKCHFTKDAHDKIN